MSKREIKSLCSILGIVLQHLESSLTTNHKLLYELVATGWTMTWQSHTALYHHCIFLTKIQSSSSLWSPIPQHGLRYKPPVARTQAKGAMLYRQS